MPAAQKKSLWTCPHCGAKLVTKNMWHSCGNFSIDALFEKCQPNVRKTFEALRKAVEAAAKDVAVVPQKTRAVFQLRTRFISVYPRKDHLLAGFIFTEKVRDECFVKIEGPITGAYVHYARLGGPKDIDSAVKAWIKWTLPYGRQERPLGKRRA
jgi:hypothetical protein